MCDVPFHLRYYNCKMKQMVRKADLAKMVILRKFAEFMSFQLRLTCVSHRV